MTDFYNNKIIVVTGGSGMIGTHMIQHLLDKDAWVRTSTHTTSLRCKHKNQVYVVENIDSVSYTHLRAHET